MTDATTAMLADNRQSIMEWAGGNPDLLSARCAKAEQALEARSRVLLDVEGCLLAYWTDIPQGEILRLTVEIRSVLGSYEPASAAR